VTSSVVPRAREVAVQLPESAWADAAVAFRGARDAVLACHVAPDGDALGSMLALARVLRADHPYAVEPLSLLIEDAR